jgi:hypothetical protein
MVAYVYPGTVKVGDQVLVGIYKLNTWPQESTLVAVAQCAKVTRVKERGPTEIFDEIEF